MGSFTDCRRVSGRPARFRRSRSVATVARIERSEIRERPIKAATLFPGFADAQPGLRLLILKKERATRPRSEASLPRIPLVAAVLPEAAFAAGDLGKAIQGLDAVDVFGVLVADMTLHPQPQRRTMSDRQGFAVHPVSHNGLRMEGVEQVEGFVVKPAVVGGAHHPVPAVETDV